MSPPVVAAERKAKQFEKSVHRTAQQRCSRISWGSTQSRQHRKLTVAVDLLTGEVLTAVST